MSNSTSQTKHFLNRKWPLLVIIAVLVAFVAIVALSWLSITIKSFPSCLTYQSDESAQLDGLLQASFGNYLMVHGFEAASSESGEITWNSRAVFVQWSSGSKLWLNVCSKNEESMDWLAVAQDLQELSLRAHWSPGAFLRLNPDITACRTGNDIPLGFPVDFKKIGASIKRVKATCEGARRL